MCGMGRKIILSIDGGGIRGIIPAVALAKLEQTTGKPARETVSFAAGTSTGALLSAAVAAGIPAARIVEIYRKRGKEIFSPGAPWNTIRQYTTGHKYDTRNLYKVLKEEFGPAADWKLNDCPIDVLITATALSDGKPWYFVRDNPKNARTTGTQKLLDCATASAAAPTYFEPWPLPAPVGKLVDGGVGVTGNPVYQACVEAFFYHDGYQPEETTVISFGTGRFQSQKSPGSILAWLNWVLDELLHSPQDQQTLLVRRHFTATVFHRLDPTIKKDVDMDGVGEVEYLYGVGREFAQGVDWPAML